MLGAIDGDTEHAALRYSLGPDPFGGQRQLNAVAERLYRVDPFEIYSVARSRKCTQKIFGSHRQLNQHIPEGSLCIAKQLTQLLLFFAVAFRNLKCPQSPRSLQQNLAEKVSYNFKKPRSFP